MCPCIPFRPDGVLLFLSSKCGYCSHGLGHLLQIQGHSHLTCPVFDTSCPHTHPMYIFCSSLWSAYPVQTPSTSSSNQTHQSFITSAPQPLLLMSGSSLFLSLPVFLRRSQVCLGHPSAPSLECVQYLGNVYLHIRQQAKTSLKFTRNQATLKPCLFEVEGQGFDNHQHQLFGLASVCLTVFSVYFFTLGFTLGVKLH